MVSLEETPRDFARLLQFVYTHAYDRKPGDSTASRAVPLQTFVSEEELLLERWDTEEAREKLDIDKSVLELARKYDCESLREFIVTHLVVNLPYSRGFLGEVSFFPDSRRNSSSFSKSSAQTWKRCQKSMNVWRMRYSTFGSRDTMPKARQYHRSWVLAIPRRVQTSRGSCNVLSRTTEVSLSKW